MKEMSPTAVIMLIMMIMVYNNIKLFIFDKITSFYIQFIFDKLTSFYIL